MPPHQEGVGNFAKTNSTRIGETERPALNQGLNSGRCAMTIENHPDLKNRYFFNLFATSPIGIFIVQEGKFQHVNPEFQKISGYTEDELIGTESSRIIFDEDLPAVKEKAVKMLKAKRSSPYLYRAVDKMGA